MLSKRLKTVADMVTRGNIVADIGTDHGYVPIYLIKNKISPYAYAMDINMGPLKSAEKNIKSEGLSEKIETILSDGMEKFEPGMADTVIIAGMGGELIIRILKASKAKKSIKELVLSPHKGVDLVRKYILSENWHITDEKMLTDAGKYYTVIKAEPGKETLSYSEIEYTYGRILLARKDSVLKEYLEKQNNKFTVIRDTMKENNSRNIDEIEHILECNMKGRGVYDSRKC